MYFIAKNDTENINHLTSGETADIVRKGCSIIDVLTRLGYNVGGVKRHGDSFVIKGEELGLPPSSIFIQIVKYPHPSLKTQYILAGFSNGNTVQKTGTCLKATLTCILDELC